MSLLAPLPGGGRPLSILVANRIVPRPDRDAGSLRLLRLIELMLADGHRVTLLAQRDEPGQQEAAMALEVLGVEVHRTPADIGALLESLRPDVAWLSFHDVAATCAPALRERAPGARVIVDAVDVHWLRESRAAELSGREDEMAAALRTRDGERAAYASADALVAVSAEDGAALTQLAPGIPVTVIPTIHPSEDRGAGFAQRDGVLFVGNFRHRPNVDAARFLCDEIWPRVRAVLPDARLTLAGDAPPPEVLALAGPGVDVTGWVPEIAPYLETARVSIAPLRYGAGVKGKIGEALAHGVPVVTTAIGAEGMGLVDDEHALVAEDAEALAAATVRLHQEPELWARLVRAGRERVSAALSPAVARDGLRRTLAGAAPSLFVAGHDLDDGALRAVLASYLGTFAEGDAVSLVLPVTGAGGADALLRRLLPLLSALGHDPEHIPDVVLTPWPEGAPVPRGARPAGGWALAPVDPEPAPVPRAAVAVRLPVDPGDAAVQRAAVAACALPADVELLLLSEDDSAPSLDKARAVRLPAGAGRRLAQLRAVHATAAPVVVILEPHALPEPGFAEPLITAAEGGAAFAGPVLAGHHGLRVAADGSLWPLDAGDVEALEALPFDCLAATRQTWLAAPQILAARDGHAETQLGAWARPRGGVVVADAAAILRQPAPPASVLICTRNRCDELVDAVDLLVAHGAVDIVLADNASTDATPQVAEALSGRYPGTVQVVHEPRPGLSHARNTAAAAARHDLLLFLDDDARPGPGWLEAISRELARPGVVNAGGPIHALWPAERPAGWPAPGMERFFSVLGRGDADAELVPPAVVYGANWAVRREALIAAGGFDPDFGPGPGVAVNGDETSVAWRLHRRGLGTTRFVAAASVGHRVSPDRISDGFLIHRSLCVGIERARLTVALDGVDHERLTRDARGAAGRLLNLVPLGGDLRLEDVVAAIGASSLSQPRGADAADAAGELAACVLLMGQTEVAVGALRLRFDPQHLGGTLRVPVAP
jgi:glycosyltransferase involved in cell wall biosynthesis/GT2 family glycosyltransferase